MLASRHRADVGGHGADLLQAEHEHGEHNRMRESQPDVANYSQRQAAEQELSRPQPMLNMAGKLCPCHSYDRGEGEDSP